MVSVKTHPTRYFKIGAMQVKDECSALPFQKAFEILSKQYPIVRHTQIFEADGVAQNDGSILYEVPLIKAATNG